MRPIEAENWVDLGSLLQIPPPSGRITQIEGILWVKRLGSFTVSLMWDLKAQEQATRFYPVVIILPEEVMIQTEDEVWRIYQEQGIRLFDFGLSPAKSLRRNLALNLQIQAPSGDGYNCELDRGVAKTHQTKYNPTTGWSANGLYIAEKAIPQTALRLSSRVSALT